MNYLVNKLYRNIAAFKMTLQPKKSYLIQEGFPVPLILRNN